jgi:hypothetical protein
MAGRGADEGGESPRIGLSQKPPGSAPGSYGPGDRKAAVECRKATRPRYGRGPPKPARAKAGRLSGCAFRRSTPSHFLCGGREREGNSRAFARGDGSRMPGDIQLQQTNARHTAQANLPAVPKPADDDPVPENIDDFRNELARRISRLIAVEQGYWRGCQERACRRRRACVAPRIHCSNAPPLPPMTPEQEAQAIAQVQHMLREVMAQREQGE